MADVLQLAIHRRQQVREEIEKLDDFIRMAESLLEGTRFGLVPAEQEPANLVSSNDAEPESDHTPAAPHPVSGESAPDGHGSKMERSSSGSKSQVFWRAPAR